MRGATYPAYENRIDLQSERIDFPVPSHWSSKKARFIFRFSKGLTITKEDLEESGIPCVNYGEVHSKFGFEVDPDIHDLKFVSHDYIKKNGSSLLKRGDFVFADTSEDIEGSGNFTYLNSDTPAFAGYHTLIARPTSGTVTRYLAYMLDSQAFRKQVQKAVKGVKVYSISQGLLKDLEILFPPIQEQHAIASFLDKKCPKIDAAIALEERQIALLKERKQIVIQNAVTKGLNPNAPMKDSGVDCIGEIPAHWEVTKLGACLKVVSEKNHPDLPLLSITREQGVIERDVDDQESNHNFIPDDLSGYKLIKAGQFGMNKMKAWQGSYGVSRHTGIISPAYFIFDFTKPIDPDFFHLAIRSKVYVAFFASASDGVRIGQWDLSKSRMREIPFILPSPSEQLSIMQHINTECAKIENAVSLKFKQIDRLREYKATLINSAVTGKIKVA